MGNVGSLSASRQLMIPAVPPTVAAAKTFIVIAAQIFYNRQRMRAAPGPKTRKNTACIGGINIMAFDGLVISNLVYELNNTILNTKISKIAQPECDELLFTLKGPNGQFRLAMSASASLPFVYLPEHH